MVTLLLVLFILDGEPSTFAVHTSGPAECMALESKVATILPKLLGRTPEFYAAKCADLKPFLTAS